MKKVTKILIIFLVATSFLYIFVSYFEYKYYKDVSDCDKIETLSYGNETSSSTKIFNELPSASRTDWWGQRGSSKTSGIIVIADGPQPECGKNFFDFLFRTDMFFQKDKWGR